jgi:hypothetical protein
LAANRLSGWTISVTTSRRELTPTIRSTDPTSSPPTSTGSVIASAIANRPSPASTTPRSRQSITIDARGGMRSRVSPIAQASAVASTYGAASAAEIASGAGTFPRIRSVSSGSAVMMAPSPTLATTRQPAPRPPVDPAAPASTPSGHSGTSTALEVQRRAMRYAQVTRDRLRDIGRRFDNEPGSTDLLCVNCGNKDAGAT